MKQQKITTKDMILIAMFTAIIVILSQISIPLPSGVPITLQTFAIALIGVMIGYKKGVLAVCTYILLGCVGVPVFSNFQGGLGILFGKTGGFIIGFIPMVIIIGIRCKKILSIFSVIKAIIGIAFCHALGVLQFLFITKMSIFSTFMLVSAPFLIKDIISVVLAIIIGQKVISSYPQMFRE